MVAWFGSYHGPLMSSFLYSLRLGQPGTWGAAFIEGSTAELAVLNTVLEKGAWRAACVQHLCFLC